MTKLGAQRTILLHQCMLEPSLRSTVYLIWAIWVLISVLSFLNVCRFVLYTFPFRWPQRKYQWEISFVIWRATNLYKLDDFQNALSINPLLREQCGMWRHFAEANNAVLPLPSLKWSWLWCHCVPLCQLWSRRRWDQLCSCETSQTMGWILWM